MMATRAEIVSLINAAIDDINKQTDDICIKNQQGTLYNYVEHKPTATRLYENKHITGIDFDLLPHKKMNIPKNKI